MRTELPQLIDLADRLLEHREPAILATLFSSRGSSYRSLGSMMVGGPPTIAAGGVSGGCLEEYVLRHGREMTRDRAAVLISFDTGGADDVDDAKPVLGCGGSIDILVERLNPGHVEFLRNLAEAHLADTAALMTCTVTTDDSGEVIDVTRRWGRPHGARSLTDLAHRAMQERCSFSQPRAVGSNERTLVQYIPPLTRLVLFGAGKDARPVCDLAHSLGWHVIVVDHSARRARAEHFPAAAAVVAMPWDQAVEQIVFTPHAAAVLLTHSMVDDATLLSLLAEKPVGYIGMLGPAHRRDAIIGIAKNNGSPLPDDLLARLRGPIGLNLGDRSAPGIAIALIAEIMAELNERDARPLSEHAPSRVRGSLGALHE